MMYEAYIKETADNCMSVLAECSKEELSDLDHLKKLLWDDNRVTGVYSETGRCTSLKTDAKEYIKDIIFDKKFLDDVKRGGMNMQLVMAQGPEAIDIAARTLALTHISIPELARKELARREDREKQYKKSAVRV